MRRTPGFTLLEVIIVFTVAVIMTGAVIRMYLVSARNIQESATFCDLQSRATSVLERIAKDVKDSGTSAFTLTSAQKIVFQKCTGYGLTSDEQLNSPAPASHALYGSSITYELLPTPATRADGQDYYTLQRSNSSGSTIMTDSVSSSTGMQFSLSGQVLQMTLTLKATNQADRYNISSTDDVKVGAYSTKVQFKNP